MRTTPGARLREWPALQRRTGAPAESRRDAVPRRRGSCSAASRRASPTGRAPTRSSCSSTRPWSRSAAARRRRASCTSRTEPRSRSSRPTAAASRPSTGRGSSSATRSSTSRRHGQDVKRYVRDLEDALIATLARGRRRGRAHRRAHRCLADAPATEDRVDRHPRLALGDDARVRAQRRPRSCAVHRVDHGLRARGRRVHDDRTRARAAGGRRRGPPARRGGARGVFGLAFERLDPDDDALPVCSERRRRDLAAPLAAPARAAGRHVPGAQRPLGGPHGERAPVPRGSGRQALALPRRLRAPHVPAGCDVVAEGDTHARDLRRGLRKRRGPRHRARRERARGRAGRPRRHGRRDVAPDRPAGSRNRPRGDRRSSCSC